MTLSPRVRALFTPPFRARSGSHCVRDAGRRLAAKRIVVWRFVWAEPQGWSRIVKPRNGPSLWLEWESAFKAIVGDATDPAEVAERLTAAWEEK